MLENERLNEMSADECFAYMKSKKQNITHDGLDEIADTCLELINKYRTTGQVQGMRKLIFHYENIEREHQLVNLGINTFVYKSDIENYIEKVTNRSVKVCEIGDYERDIPDDIVNIIKQTKDIFSVMYIVYTDYTGKSERRIAAQARTQDPILFGSFQNRNDGVCVERFYYLGDWIDEYCDLTLDKMVAETKKKTGKEIRREISTPQDIEELKAQLENLRPRNGFFVQEERTAKKVKKNLAKRIWEAIKSK